MQELLFYCLGPVGSRAFGQATLYMQLPVGTQPCA